MKFGTALEHLKKGRSITRKGMDKKFGIYLATEDMFSKIMNSMYTTDTRINTCLVYGIREENKLIYGWLPSVEDLLAEDWKILEFDTITILTREINKLKNKCKRKVK